VLSPEVTQGNISMTICVSGWAATGMLAGFAAIGAVVRRRRA
jgi:hypothetical protein